MSMTEFMVSKDILNRRAIRGHWLYDHYLTHLSKELACLRQFRRRRKSAAFRQTGNDYIFLNCNTRCYWIFDTTSSQIIETGSTQSEETCRQSFQQDMGVLSERLRGRAIWIEVEHPITVSLKLPPFVGAWIRPNREKVRMTLIPSAYPNQDYPLAAQQVFAAIAARLLSPEMHEAETRTNSDRQRKTPYKRHNTAQWQTHYPRFVEAVDWFTACST